MRRALRRAVLATTLVVGGAAVAPSAAGASTPSFQTVKTYPYPRTSPGPISCVGPTFCMQVVFGWLLEDQNPQVFVRSTTDGGATWTTVGAIRNDHTGALGFTEEGTLTCASSRVCVFTDQTTMDRTTDGGAAWQPLAGFLSPVACLPSGGCLAVANPSGGEARAWWAPATSGTLRHARGADGLPAALQPTALSCRGSWCLAAGTVGGRPFVATTATAGPAASWTAVPPTHVPQLSDVSCGAPAHCAGVATVYTSPSHTASRTFLVATVDGGRAWTRRALALPTSTSWRGDVGISCATAEVCTASVAAWDLRDSETAAVLEAVHTADGGASWTTAASLATIASALYPFDDASCTTATSCTADVWVPGEEANGGRSEVTSDGATWTPAPLAATDASNLSLTCTTADTCYRIDYLTSATGLATALYASTDDGSAWTAVAVPAGIQPMKIAGCQSATTCEVFGVEGASLYDGLEGVYDWSHATTVLLTTTNGGGSWSTTPISTPEGATPELASCTSTEACVAVLEVETSPVSDEIVATTTGTSWSTTSLPAGYYAFEGSVAASAVENTSSLSCSAGGFCLLGTIAGSGNTELEVSSDSGRSWKPEATPASFADVGAVQCFGTDSCDVAYSVLTTSWRVSFAQTTDGGSSWTHTSVLRSGLIGLLFGVDLSCTTLDACTAVIGRSGGNPAPLATTDGGSTWSSLGWDATAIPKGDVGAVAVAFLSCSTTACVVATEGVFLERPGVLQLAALAR